MRAPVDHPRDHPGLLQQLQMARDGRLRDAEAIGDLPHGGGPAAEPRDDVTAERMGQRPEHIISHFANYIGTEPRHLTEEERAMTEPTIVTRAEWDAAREELLKREKEVTRLNDEVTRERRKLPWVPIEKDYSFATQAGTKRLAELFDGRSQLVVYHFMFGPDYEAGCPVCS